MLKTKPDKGVVQGLGAVCVLVLLLTAASRDWDLPGALAVLVTYLVTQVIFQVALRSGDIRRRPRNLLFVA